MEKGELEREIAGLATLDEPVRRALYLYVVSRHREVGRDEAARAVGVSRTLAGFHLDRLAAEGLLETSFRRLSGRKGPGAGRPSKLYRRSERQLGVTLPPRRYELAARLLAGAVDASRSRSTGRALEKVARAVGQDMGGEAKARAGSRAGKRRRLADTMATLTAHGYEPEKAGGEIRLRNCPFHGLVQEHRELACGMNLALLEGLVAGLELPGLKATLDPKPGMCCVALRTVTPPRERRS